MEPKRHRPSGEELDERTSVPPTPDESADGVPEAGPRPESDADREARKADEAETQREEDEEIGGDAGHA